MSEEEIEGAVAEPAADAPVPTEPEATEPEVAEARVTSARQWVSLRGTSMDARVGLHLVDGIGNDMKSVVGRPRACALAVGPSADADAVEAFRRELTSVGFLVSRVELPGDAGACSLASLGEVLQAFAGIGLTGDDLVMAMGDAYALSLVSHAAAGWCGGVALTLVPTDLTAALYAPVTPRPLDVAGFPRLVTRDGMARYEFCDLGLMEVAGDSESVLLARALMVAAAMADSDKVFERLWDRSEQLVAGDLDTVATQMADSLRSRGRLVSSTSVAVRQSAAYGMTFTHAVRTLVGDDVPTSSILADALRFAGRLAVAQGFLGVDDMFAQDEALDRLGLDTVRCAVDPDQMVAAIKSERFRTTNRLMLCLPRAIGRVRLTAVDDDLLAEHVGAWCASRGA